MAAMALAADAAADKAPTRAEANEHRQRAAKFRATIDASVHQVVTPEQ